VTVWRKSIFSVIDRSKPELGAAIIGMAASSGRVPQTMRRPVIRTIAITSAKPAVADHAGHTLARPDIPSPDLTELA